MKAPWERDGEEQESTPAAAPGGERPGRRRRIEIPGGKARARAEDFFRRRSIHAPFDDDHDALRLPNLLAPAEPSGPEDVGGSAYFSAVKAKERLLSEETMDVASPEWRFLGPSSIPQGQTYGSGPGSDPPVSGRVASIAIDPTDGAHVLLGSANGGIWETRDTGAHWTPRTDDQPSLSIGAVAFDPTDPTKAFAGTGEGNSLMIAGLGLLKTEDGGTTWRVVAEDPFVDVWFYDVAVDPADGDRVLAATTAGTFLSIDAGTSWQKVLTDLTWDLSIIGATASSSEVLAACRDGLHRSTDGGATWTSVALVGAPAHFVFGHGRMAVAHAPSDHGVAYVFAAAGASALLWRRSAADQGFTAIGTPGIKLDQAWYDWYIAVHPGDPSVVYLGAIDLFRGEGDARGGTFRWTNVSTRKGHGDSIHPDQHAIAFDPVDPDVLFAGSDGGLFRSTDRGESWQALNTGLGIAEFEYLASRPHDDVWILGGTQDNGTLRHDKDEVWTQSAVGDGGDCASVADTDTCYHSFYDMWLERSDKAGDPTSWEDASPPIPDGYRSLFYPPLEVNGSLVARAGESIFLSTDGAKTWVETKLPAGDALASALAVPAPDQVLVGTDHGHIHRIEIRNGRWQGPTLLAQPRPGVVSDLAVDATNASRIWATYSDIPGAVYRSEDGGASWSDVTGNLPHVPVNAIALDPANADTVWVATDIGVFGSIDAGGSWAVYGRGLPNVLAGDLVFQAVHRLLRVGTRARGVWEVVVP